MPLPVLAQGPDWIAIAKPSGLPVHRDRPGGGAAVVQELRDQIGRRVWPVHRLDGGTSGCLLLALSSEAVAPLHEALRTGTKHYVAVVRGELRASPVHVTRSLRDDVGVPRDAATTVHRLGGGPDPRASLVLAIPHTGRLHQVRRHLNGLAHPVLGDSRHGDTRINRWWREQRGLDRLALHCWQLRLDLPGGARVVRAPLPQELVRPIEGLPWWPAAHERLLGWQSDEVPA